MAPAFTEFLRIPLRALLQESRARLQIFLSALGCDRRGLLRLKIEQIGLAVAAADRVEMEANVAHLFVAENTQEEAAELLPRRTAQSIAPPDLAERMHSRIAAAVDRLECAEQLRVAAQGLLDRRHPRDWERFVEIGLEFGVGQVSWFHTALETDPPRAAACGATSGGARGTQISGSPQPAR